LICTCSQVLSEMKALKSYKAIKRNELYYTQGLFFDTDSTVMESGGQYGRSSLVRMKYPSMEVLKKVDLHKKYFAEGIALCGGYVFQLTWRERVVLKYKYPELELVETASLDDKVEEGWGLTTDGKVLYATDGSNNIYTMSCETLKVTKTTPVTLDAKPVHRLNEIEYVDGVIYANKYYDSNIYKIDLNSGKVIKVIDMNSLVMNELSRGTLTHNKLQNGDVLNGIAFNKNKGNFLVTGKMWGFYYEVNLK